MSRILKEREDETSQLNRLGVAYFHVYLFPISATWITSAFRRREALVALLVLLRF